MDSETFPSRQQLFDALDPRRLFLLILPTEQCNFRCTYCYEDFSSGKMRPEVVQGIKRLVDRRVDDVSCMQVSWFGGEPLIAKDIVFDVSEHVARRCAEKGIEHVRGSMTTNGYFLAPAVMERLCAANQRQFQVSVDGLGAVHDRTRHLVSGKGTFDRLWGNLTALRRTDLEFHVNLRVHFGACDPSETQALCREIDRVFGGDGRFSVYLKCIENYGGANAGRITPLAPEEARKASEHYATLMPGLVVTNMYQKGLREICYAAHPNNLMIRADGRVGKCALSLGDPRNTIGRLDPDGRLHIDNDRLQPWMAGFAQLDEEVLVCPMQGVGRTPLPEREAVPVTFRRPRPPSSPP